MVHSLLAHPEAYCVAGNLVNSPIAHWLHYHTGAIRPYLPDLVPPQTYSKPSWRPSLLPGIFWHRGAGLQFRHTRIRSSKMATSGKHDREPAKTPIAAASYDAFGPGWSRYVPCLQRRRHQTDVDRWQLAAQQHYSLFENLERGELDRYWAGTKDGLWSHSARPSLQHQFLADMGLDPWQHAPIGDNDEYEMSQVIPMELGKLFSWILMPLQHISPFTCRQELRRTDVLDRYRSYANEMVWQPSERRLTGQRTPYNGEFGQHDNSGFLSEDVEEDVTSASTSDEGDDANAEYGDGDFAADDVATAA
ncbi:hypothetical protein MRB53_039517 [Persea americana]|nr:hypothetical protein MRB53_039517 [Persea americana]